MPKGVYIRGEKTKQVPKCHPNNKYKALGLCQSCYAATKVNPDLGFSKDQIDVLKRSIEYLEK